jgi:AcrR family transcriptional regulator
MLSVLSAIMSHRKQPASPLRVSPQPILKLGKSERTRAAILNAALDFIWSHPFRDMTVNSLMTSTGLSRSAFYQYFDDLHELMETLLHMLQDEVFASAQPYFEGVGDPVVLLGESLAGLVRVGHERGPFLRAITDAAVTDSRLEKAWAKFTAGFDDAVEARIKADQEQGLTPVFDARPVAHALNRLDAYTLIDAFGAHPRSEPEPVREALARIWVSTLYGSEWLGKESSNLVRK